MSRRAITRRRRPHPPASLTRIVLDDGGGAGYRQVTACFIHEAADGLHYWACTDHTLYRASLASGGTEWDGTRITSFDTARFGASGIEGLFISSGGDIFVTAGGASGTDGVGSLVAVAVGKGTSQVAIADTDFVRLECNDHTESTPGTKFIPTSSLSSNSPSTGMSPNQWSFWEVEHDWEATGGLQIGDIIMSVYHRSESMRNAFIYVLRKRHGVWCINASPAGMMPSDYPTEEGMIGDPFLVWNSKWSRIVRHVHHITIDLEGYLVISTGDTAQASQILSSEEDFSYGGVRITTAAPHLLPSECIVKVAGHSISSLNMVSTVEPADATSFIMLDAFYEGVDGTGGTFSPKLAYEDGAGTDNFYRTWRVSPSLTAGAKGVPQQIAAGGNGNTAMVLLDDGYMLMGNDAAVQGTGSAMGITLWGSGTFLKTVYMADVAANDWPIFELVRHNNKVFAGVQRNAARTGGYLTYPASHGALLVADITKDPRDMEFRVLIESTADPKSPGFINVDRIWQARRRNIPGSATKLLFSVQPEYTQNGEFFSIDL